jgi:hypothetical protein
LNCSVLYFAEISGLILLGTRDDDAEFISSISKKMSCFEEKRSSNRQQQHTPHYLHTNISALLPILLSTPWVMAHECMRP